MTTLTKIPREPLTEAGFLILLCLFERPMHGYLVMQIINTDFDTGFKMSPGTLYRTLQRLMVAELIEEIDLGDVPPEDERRRGYKINRRGRSAAGFEIKRLDALLRTARKQLEANKSHV